jgi:hypothetical protein
MTTLSTQAVLQTYSPPLGQGAPSSLTAPSSGSANDSLATPGYAQAGLPASTTPDSDAIAAAKAAAANSGGYSFSSVAQSARTVLDSGEQQLGHAPDIYTNGKQWDQIFGNMDRRSLYAVASNQGSQFTVAEQQVARNKMDAQFTAAVGNASTGSGAGNMQAFGRGIAFLQTASPEEKQSVRWAAGMASVKTCYNDYASDLGQPPDNDTYSDPLLKVIMAAMKAGQSDPSKDRTIAQSDTLAEIKSEPWAQGFGDQIDAAYAASRPQGGLLDVQA